MKSEFLRRSWNICFDGWRKLNSKMFIKLSAFLPLNTSQECVLYGMVLRNYPENENRKRRFHLSIS